MEEEREDIVLRYRDGRTEAAKLIDIDSSRDFLLIARGDGSSGEVPYGELKAVFFPRKLPEEALETPAGSLITVDFLDGETMRGTAHYNPEKHGFFLYPVDRSKNDRVFIVHSALGSIEVEKL